VHIPLYDYHLPCCALIPFYDSNLPCCALILLYDYHLPCCIYFSAHLPCVTGSVSSRRKRQCALTNALKRDQNTNSSGIRTVPLLILFLLTLLYPFPAFRLPLTLLCPYSCYARLENLPRLVEEKEKKKIALTTNRTWDIYITTRLGLGGVRESVGETNV